jgi:hypothetical protein
MKSAHRHQLETNALAHRLEIFIERYRPYASRIVGGLIAVVILMLIWSLISGSSAARRSEAWDTFNQAIGAVPRPNLDELRRTSQDYPGTPIQELADVTWADGQVMMAAYEYLANRKLAMEHLDRAMSAYQGVIQSSDNEQLIGRAHLGLARVHEMQNQLEKARAEYRSVTGAYADYAQRQAERLEKPEAQEAYAWLSTAEVPRPQAPVGPGVPGQRPDFTPGDMPLPGTTIPEAGKTEDTKAAADLLDEILKGPNDDSKKSDAAETDKAEQKPATGSPAEPPAKDLSPDAANEPAPPPGKAEADEKKSAESSDSSPSSDKSTK